MEDYNNATDAEKETMSIVEVNGQYYTTKIAEAIYDWSGISMPVVSGGLTTGFIWKGITLNLLFNYQLGGKMYDSGYADLMVGPFGWRYRVLPDIPIFSGVGGILRNDNSTEPRARASVEDVYRQINDDLDESVRLLSATTVQRSNKSYINVHVARGLKARVLLTQGKWLDAAETAKLVVEQSGAKLQDDTYTTTENRFSDQTNTEWLWSSKPTLTPVTNLTHFHGYMSNENISYNQNTPRAILFLEIQSRTPNRTAP
jgi:hypothetical protein